MGLLARKRFSFFWFQRKTRQENRIRYVRGVIKNGHQLNLFVTTQFPVHRTKSTQVVRTEFPLLPASAKTLHSTQILVNVNTNRAISRIHYVASSRVTTIKGLFIIDLWEEKISVDERVSFASASVSLLGLVVTGAGQNSCVKSYSGHLDHLPVSSFALQPRLPTSICWFIDKVDISPFDEFLLLYLVHFNGYKCFVGIRTFSLDQTTDNSAIKSSDDRIHWVITHECELHIGYKICSNVRRHKF